MSRIHAVLLALPVLAVAAGPCAAASLSSSQQRDALPLQVAQSTSTVIIAPSAPPPIRAEVVPPPPAGESTLVIWQQGHWAWSGTNWVWVAGQYVTPPAPKVVWDPGHWVQQSDGTWKWVDGQWRAGSG
jgi:YXWGXW repeat-containing protein